MITIKIHFSIVWLQVYIKNLNNNTVIKGVGVIPLIVQHYHLDVSRWQTQISPMLTVGEDRDKGLMKGTEHTNKPPQFPQSVYRFGT